MVLLISSMTYFNKPSFISVFLFIFSLTLVILGSIQALFGTMRWYNESEQTHEKFQNYPVYSASEQPGQTGVIRVFIAPKPTTTESNVYAFIQNTASVRETALATVAPEKAESINQKIQDIVEITPIPTVPVAIPEVFTTPVKISTKPASARMPQGYS